MNSKKQKVVGGDPGGGLSFGKTKYQIYKSWICCSEWMLRRVLFISVVLHYTNWH